MAQRGAEVDVRTAALSTLEADLERREAELVTSRADVALREQHADVTARQAQEATVRANNAEQDYRRRLEELRASIAAVERGA